MESSRTAVEGALRALMLRGLAGDAAAHSTLLEALSRMLRGYLRNRLGGHSADAEDLLQETLIAVHERRHSYDVTQPFTPWVYAVARYKLIDQLRRNRVRATLPLDDFEDLFAADDELGARDAGRDIDALLSTLSPAQRTAIQLTRIEGYSIEEAAAQTGKSESSIKVEVHRGLRKLTALFAKEDRS